GGTAHGLQRWEIWKRAVPMTGGCLTPSAWPPRVSVLRANRSTVRSFTDPAVVAQSGQPGCWHAGPRSPARRLPHPAKQASTPGSNRAGLLEWSQHIDRLLPCGVRVIDDVRKQVESDAELLGDIHPLRFLLVKATADADDERETPLRLGDIPGLGGERSQPFVGDRQVAAVGGVARLQFGQLLAHLEGLPVQRLRGAGAARRAGRARPPSGARP